MKYLKRFYNLLLILFLAFVVFVFSWITLIEIFIITPIYYIISGKFYLKERDLPLVILMGERIYKKLKL